MNELMNLDMERKKLSFDDWMETGKFLTYGFMGSRFIDLVEKKKKLEEKDIEFVFRVIEFFESAKKGRESSEKLDLAIGTVEDLEIYGICLRIIPKMYNDEKMKLFDGKLDSFIDNIRTIFDLGEIIPKQFKEEEKFFRELRRFAINENAGKMMRCH